MKYIITILLIFGFSILRLTAQDVIPPYHNYSTVFAPLNMFPAAPEMPYYILNPLQPNEYKFNTVIQQPTSSYNGEYMVDFGLLPWFKNYSIGPGQNFGWDYAKSYKVEVVGFPFIALCYAQGPGACLDYITTAAHLQNAIRMMKRPRRFTCI